MCLTVFILPLLFCLLNSQNSAGLIVPEDLASGISYSYAYIPKVKKGIDSRFGVGLRLGKHAAFQVLLELGPQLYTRPLGKSTKKRQLTKKENQIDNPRMFYQHGMEKFPKKPQIDPNIVNQLQRLYKMAGDEAKITTELS